MHRHSQNSFFVDAAGNQLIDFIGKYENMAEDMHLIESRLSLPKLFVPHLNTSDHNAFERYYSSTTEGIVREILKDDFARFGY
jgi:hypothetical protein